MNKRKIILVTDGDLFAKMAVEVAAKNIGARCISDSWGNPTRLSGKQIFEKISQTPHDPVVVMVDDRGKVGEGPGERVVRYLVQHPLIEVLGVVAVASNTIGVEEVPVDESITNEGKIIIGPVNKDGRSCRKEQIGIYGDTVEILQELYIPVVIGIGDIGKMNGADEVVDGAPLTTKALKEVLLRSGYFGISCSK